MEFLIVPRNSVSPDFRARNPSALIERPISFVSLRRQGSSLGPCLRRGTSGDPVPEGVWGEGGDVDADAGGARIGRSASVGV